MVTALHNRENCGTGFSRKLQLVLVVNLASGVFGLFTFHRFEDWTAQHQADKLQLVLVVILLPAFSIFSLSPFHRFEDWTAQHQADKLDQAL